MKKLLITTVSLLLAGLSFAQQDAQFSQNMFNRLPVNPGVAGSNDAICATLLYRQQWLGFISGGEGIPKTGLLTIDAPVKILHGGIGLTVINDQIGFNNATGARLAYAYSLNLGSGRLGIGLGAGILNMGVDGNNWVVQQQNDPNVPQSSSDLKPDFDFGLYYNTTDLYVGVSSTHLAGGNMNLSTATYTVARHYYLLGGYNYSLNQTWMLKPSFWIKSDLASTQYDVNMSVLYNNLVWGGVSYRVKDAIVALLGMNIGSFKVGYSYDITTSRIKNYSSGSHEIMLGYCFKPKVGKPLPLNRNVRFL